MEILDILPHLRNHRKVYRSLCFKSLLEYKPLRPPSFVPTRLFECSLVY